MTSNKPICFLGCMGPGIFGIELSFFLEGGDREEKKLTYRKGQRFGEMKKKTSAKEGRQKQA